MAKGISLNLGSTTARRPTAFWIHLSNVINMQRSLQEKGKNIERIIARDRRVFSAVETLLQAKKTIVKYGASESIMSVFNAGNQLADVIGCTIPTVSAINQRSVGEMCVEGIDAVVENAEGKVCEFFDELVKGIAEYIEQLRKTAECQKATLEGLSNDLLADIQNIDASAFGTDEVFGYAAPVFMERLAALNAICNAFKAQDVCAALRSCAAPLEMIGYKVEKTVDVVETTPEEQAAAAPAPEEVMSAPIAEPAAEAPVSQEDLEPEQQREGAVPATEVPADAPQEQEVAVLRWTPASIKEAVVGLLTVLASVDGIFGAADIVGKIKADACAEGCADVDAKRTLAASIGTIVRVVGGAISELFDQVVAMCGKLKKAEVPAEAPQATPVEEVTEAAPLGDRCAAKRRRRKSKRARDEFEGGDVTEHEFEPEKQMDDPAGTLPDDEEGPIEEENVPQARRGKKARRTRNEFEGGDVTEHEFEPEKQMEEQAGEMSDDEEGPIQEEDVPHAGTPESMAPGEGSKTSDECGWFFDEEEVPAEPADAPTETIPEEPVTVPAVPAETTEVPPQPVTPVNPDGTPIVEEPLVPPQPVAEEPASDRWFFDEDDNDMGDPAGALEEDTEGPVEEEPAPSAGTPESMAPGEGSKATDRFGWLFDEDNVEEPEGLGDLETADPEPIEEPAKGVDPNGDPDIPDMVTEPHVEPVETPPEEIPEQKAEELISDTRFSFL